MVGQFVVSVSPLDAAKQPTQQEPCQPKDLPLVECDLGFLKKISEKALLERINRVAYKTAPDDCNKEEVESPESLGFYLSLPKTGTAVPRPRFSQLEYQFYGAVNSKNLLGRVQSGQDARSFRFAMPLDSTADVQSLFRQRGQGSPARQSSKDLDLVEIIFIPRLESEGGQVDEGGEERLRILPATAVPSRALMRSMATEGRARSSSCDDSQLPPESLISFRSWMEKLERTGIQFLRIVQDYSFEMNDRVRLSANETYSWVELRYFEIALSRERGLVVEPEDSTEGEYLEFLNKFQCFWDEMKIRIEALEDEERRKRDRFRTIGPGF